MMRIKKTLNILVDETSCDEEEINYIKIKQQSEATFISVESEIYLNLLEKILELNNSIIKQIANYMEHENNESDLSYSWYFFNNLGLLDLIMSVLLVRVLLPMMKNLDIL